jgi:hypothetical protein
MSKLHPASLGPYKVMVISQVKNDLLTLDLVHQKQFTFSVEDAFPFIGSAEEAARLDRDQVVIEDIVAYRGEPRQRRTIELQVLFIDGTLMWIPWSRDIFETVAYERYATSIPALRPLLHTVRDLQQLDKVLNETPITVVAEGTQVFVDLRCYGYAWYASLCLPQHEHRTYVVPYVYETFSDERTSVVAYCSLFKERWTVDHVFVVEYGACTYFNSASMVLIDRALLKKFPLMVKKTASKRNLTKE